MPGDEGAILVRVLHHIAHDDAVNLLGTDLRRLYRRLRRSLPQLNTVDVLQLAAHCAEGGALGADDEDTCLS